MSDYDDDVPTEPRRGRRQEIALSTEVGFDEQDELGEPNIEMALLPGDQILAKVSLEHPTAIGEGWMTYGATTRIQEGEDEEQAFERLASVVNTRAIDLADDVLQRIRSELEASRGRIRPKH